MNSNAPAGWYPLPDGTQRWWNGSAWAQPGPAAGPAFPGELVRSPAGPPAPQAAHPTYLTQAGGPAPMLEGRYGYQPAIRVAPKSPGVAVLASFFIPGLGQFINGQAGKGVAFLLSYFIGIALLFVIIGFLILPVVWIWSMVDAHSGARAWNARYGILS